MSTPDVPLRLDLSFELPGTVEQVWHAIATAAGISSWFMPTDLEERVGGSIVLHMGEQSSTGEVTDYDVPRRFAYEEPDWAAMVGHPDAEVTPLATEFLVEADSGGTCIVRVVSSAFGTGAGWENEFFAEMEKGWLPFFANLRLYLTNLPGQRATTLSAQATIPGRGAEVWETMRRSIGADTQGQRVEVCGIAGHVERLGERDLLMRLADISGYLMFAAVDQWTQIEGYLFSEDAAAFVERERPRLQAWLDDLAVDAPAGAPPS
jgi:uncharacterized protein YndB with AHSA1/START domain